MAPLPVITDTFRVALNWTNLLGGAATNVMHFRTTSPPATPADLFSALDAHVAIQLWESVDPNARVASVDITPLDGSSATASFAPAAVAKWAGSGIGDLVPAVACVVKLTTAQRGRSKRGRIFLPMTGEGVMDAGKLASSQQAIMNPAWSTFSDAMAEHTPKAFELVVASYKLATAETVTGIFVEQVLGTQRRRQSRLR